MKLSFEYLSGTAFKQTYGFKWSCFWMSLIRLLVLVFIIIAFAITVGAMLTHEKTIEHRLDTVHETLKMQSTTQGTQTLELSQIQIKPQKELLEPHMLRYIQRVSWGFFVLGLLILTPLMAGFYQQTLNRSRNQTVRVKNIFMFFRFEYWWRLGLICFCYCGLFLLLPLFVLGLFQAWPSATFWLSIIAVIFLVPIWHSYPLMLLAYIQERAQHKPNALSTSIQKTNNAVWRCFGLFWGMTVVGSLLFWLGSITIVGWIWTTPIRALLYSNLYQYALDDKIEPKAKQPASEMQDL